MEHKFQAKYVTECEELKMRSIQNKNFTVNRSEG